MSLSLLSLLGIRSFFGRDRLVITQLLEVCYQRSLPYIALFDTRDPMLPDSTIPYGTEG